MKAFVALLIMLAIIFFALDSSPNDAVYSKQIVGIWLAEYKSKDRSLYAETLYKKNGTKEGYGEICQLDRCKKIHFTAQWEIKNNVLISTPTYSNMPNSLQVGEKIYDRIELLDQDKMILISENGNKQIRNKCLTSKYFTIDDIRE